MGGTDFVLNRLRSRAVRPVAKCHLRLRIGIVHERVCSLRVLDVLVAALAVSVTYEATLIA